MVQSLSPEQVRLLRFRAQCLQPDTAGSPSEPAELVNRLCGFQSQELPSAHLAIRIRTQNCTVEDIKQAREKDRSIILTWAMRGTMHLISANDLGWLLPFLGPRFIKRTNKRYQQLGLNEETRQRAENFMREILHNQGPLTRKELAEVLKTKGIPVAGQAIAHLVRAAALEGIICFGPEQDGELTYVALEDWITIDNKGLLDQQQIIAELARRYLGAYNPATVDDFTRWAGITTSEARAGFTAISDNLVEVKLGNTSAWMLKKNMSWLDSPPDQQVVRLLPRYDTYLLGYTDRTFMVPETYVKRIHPGGGLIHQTVILNGQAIATWRTQQKKDHKIIIIEPFEPIDPALKPAFEVEANDIARFLESPTQLQFES